MKKFQTTAAIKAGKISIRNSGTLKAWVATQRDGEYSVVIERVHATRSLDANACYWAGFVAPLAEHTGYDGLEIHQYLKKRFLPNQHLMIQNAAGEIVDETDLEPTTTTLTKVEFSEYLSAIETWALTELGVRCGCEDGVS